MRALIFFFVAVALALAVAACGDSESDPAPPRGEVPVGTTAEEPAEATGGGDPTNILRLPEGDFTEEDARQSLRGTIAAFDFSNYCSGILSAETDADLLQAVQGGYAEDDPEDFFRAVADVEDADFLLLGKITQEECRAAAE